MEKDMSLIDKFKKECVFLEHKRIEDGEGGFFTEWIEGASFLAAIAYNSALEARVAEK